MLNENNNSKVIGKIGADPKMLRRLAKAQAAVNAFAPTQPDKAGERAVIRLAEEHVNENARRCARLLADVVYQRGPEPVALVRVEEVGTTSEEAGDEVQFAGVAHARGALVLATPSVGLMQFVLNERARFEKLDARTGELRAKSCPATFARFLIEAASVIGFRPVRGIVNVPLFMRGEIIDRPGYHGPTGSILDLPDRLPMIPVKPDKDAALQALETLLSPFAGYIEGKAEADRKRLRCAFAAAALTAVLRPSLKSAPTILLDANVAGAGKGKAAKALAIIASGRAPATVTEGHDDSELEKRLASALLSGAPVLLLDNLQRTLASSTLESGLTEGHATIRLFGRLTDVTVACSALVLITANNAALRADMLRRTLSVRIVADTDAPEQRRFEFDPSERARQNRPAIVAAALTIARAWWQARETDEGRTIRGTTLGSFEQWADLVGGAVEWLTGMNPVKLIEERKTEDPRRGDERAVINELATRFGTCEFTAKEACNEISTDLWAAVVAVRREPDAGTVGRWLRSRRDKVFGPLTLIGNPDRNGVMRWRLLRCGG